MRLGKGASLSSVEDASESCDYSFQSSLDQVTLMVKCKSCEGKGSLLERRCRNRVIAILVEEPVPDSIILSGFVETLYEEEAVALMKYLTDIIGRIKRFGRRELNHDDERCSRCKKSPQYVFKKVTGAFERSLASLYREVRIQSSGLTCRNSRCRNCAQTTKSDLESLSVDLDNLRSFILKHAFRISGERDVE